MKKLSILPVILLFSVLSASVAFAGVRSSASMSTGPGGQATSTQSTTVDGITTTIRTVSKDGNTETTTEYSAATPAAQRDLAWKLKSGRDGFPQDVALAVHWYEKAVEGGDGIAMNNLGLLVRDGTGVPADPERGFQLIRRAAELCPTDSVIMVNLGDCYNDGEGVPQDYAEAVSWYRKSAEQGNADAENMVCATGKAFRRTMTNP